MIQLSELIHSYKNTISLPVACTDSTPLRGMICATLITLSIFDTSRTILLSDISCFGNNLLVTRVSYIQTFTNNE